MIKVWIKERTISTSTPKGLVVEEVTQAGGATFDIFHRDISSAMSPAKLQYMVMGCTWESQELEEEMAKFALTNHMQYVLP